MSVVTAGPPTHSLAFQNPDERNDCNTVVPSRTLVWALVDALAYAGAFFDPSGVLAGHRFRRIQENELRRGRR